MTNEQLNIELELLLKEVEKCKEGSSLHYEKKEQMSNIYDKITALYISIEDVQNTLKYGKLAFELFPNNIGRNEYLTVLALQNKEYEFAADAFLYAYAWLISYNNEYTNEELIEVLENLDNEVNLDHYPRLFAIKLLLNENRQEYITKQGKKIFADKYITRVVQLIKNNPQEFILYYVATGMYKDLGDIKNSFEMRCKGIMCSTNFQLQLRMDVLIEYASKLNINFYDIKFNIEGANPVLLYNIMTSVYGLYVREHSGFENDELISLGFDLKDPRMIDMAVEFGRVCLQKFEDFFEREIGNNSYNEPHIYAMACNNYGLCLRLKYENENSSDKSILVEAYKQHRKGFNMSPFYENISHACTAASLAELSEECIESNNIMIQDYSNDWDDFDFQFAYNQILLAYLRLEKYEDAKMYYEKAKNIYLENKISEIKATKKFTNIATNIIIEFNNNNIDSSWIKTELEWLTQEDVLEKYSSQEFGILCFIYGEILFKNTQNDDAKIIFEKAIKTLEASKDDEDFGFFYKKRLALSIKYWAQITKNYDTYPISMSVLFYEENTTQRQENFPLSANYNEKNIAIMHQFVKVFYEYFSNVDKQWIDENSYMYGQRFLKEEETETCLYIIQNDNFYYTFSVFESIKITGGLFSKKTTEFIHSFSVSLRSLDDDDLYIILNGNDAENNTDQTQLNVNNYWNEICNRFYNQFPEQN